MNPPSSAFESISLVDGAVGLLMSVFFAYLVEITYRYCSNSSSGGRQLVSTLVPLSLCVCLIITVVKGSLALSLGLVGALSIVRFRTPIKDPEDLLYLFLSIVSGLGFGSGQILYTATGIVFICCFLLVRAKRNYGISRSFDRTADLVFQLTWPKKSNLSVGQAVEFLSGHCHRINLLRFNTSSDANCLHVQLNIDPKLSTTATLISSAQAFDPDAEIVISNSDLIW